MSSKINKNRFGEPNAVDIQFLKNPQITISFLLKHTCMD